VPARRQRRRRGIPGRLAGDRRTAGADVDELQAVERQVTGRRVVDLDELVRRAGGAGEQLSLLRESVCFEFFRESLIRGTIFVSKAEARSFPMDQATDSSMEEAPDWGVFAMLVAELIAYRERRDAEELRAENELYARAA
jgi:hypothetical protein